MKPEEAVVEMGKVIMELVATGSYEKALLCLKSLKGTNNTLSVRTRELTNAHSLKLQRSLQHVPC